jgi:hypothetical protein
MYNGDSAYSNGQGMAAGAGLAGEQVVTEESMYRWMRPIRPGILI